jgi:hypothetical protein
MTRTSTALSAKKSARLSAHDVFDWWKPHYNFFGEPRCRLLFGVWLCVENFRVERVTAREQQNILQKEIYINPFFL